MKLAIAAGAAVLALAFAAQAQAPEPAPLAGVSVVAPDDPLAVAQAALDRARPALNCRYAFTIAEEAAAETTDNRIDLSDRNVTRRQTMSFDPRRRLTERWTIERAVVPNRRELSNSFNSGARAVANTDLLTLTVEGDIDIDELRLVEETPDAYIYAFTPRGSGNVSPQGRTYLDALAGRLWVSKATGNVMRRELRTKEGGVDARVDVREARYTREYQTLPNGFVVLASVTSNLTLRYRGVRSESTGRQSILAVEPICDAESLAQIDAIERSNG